MNIADVATGAYPASLPALVVAWGQQRVEQHAVYVLHGTHFLLALQAARLTMDAQVDERGKDDGGYIRENKSFVPRISAQS